MRKTYEQLEKEFSCNNYYHTGDSFAIMSGDIPVILSAPHSVRHFREGKIKAHDFYTGTIVKLLHSLTKCHIIYSTTCESTDPNYDLDSKYKIRLLEYIKENNIKYCFDVHGMSINNPKIIDIGTSPTEKEELKAFKSDNELFEQIYKILDSRFPDKIGINNMFKAGPRTITNFISENSGCKCLQFEINSLYRWPDDEAKFNSIIELLEEIIIFISK